MKLKTTSIGLAAALMVAATSAHAQTAAMTTDPLNLRVGPGPNFEVTTVLPEGAQVSVLGCVENTNWCRVEAAGTTGYVYSDYLNIGSPTEVRVLGSTWQTVGVVSEAPDTSRASAAAPDPSGVLAGRDAATLGDRSNTSRFEPTQEWVTYIQANPVTPVYLDGEVMVGVGVPETVTLYEVPQSEFRYVTINDRTVLVEPASRRVVYVYE
ncbi:MAG: DUF1236 domain-containing protein [Gemmobacter sp.]|jgi:uncharacterized protein YraI|nr:DUF1236 domain-containing protein [Gemmobacter sp.]